MNTPDFKSSASLFFMTSADHLRVVEDDAEDFLADDLWPVFVLRVALRLVAMHYLVTLIA